jgi:hypothetical protein
MLAEKRVGDFDDFESKPSENKRERIERYLREFKIKQKNVMDQLDSLDNLVVKSKPIDLNVRNILEDRRDDLGVFIELLEDYLRS